MDVVDDITLARPGPALHLGEREGRLAPRVLGLPRGRRGEAAHARGPWTSSRCDLIDEKGGWIYFIASPDNAAQRYLYRGKLDGSGQPERLTPRDQDGWNEYDIAPDGSWAFHTYSRFDLPTTWSLVSLPDHRQVRVLEDNAELKKAVAKLDKGDLEFMRIDREDGPDLDGWMMKPPDFDPAKKYPVLFYVYGEPAAQTDRGPLGWQHVPLAPHAHAAGLHRGQRGQPGAARPARAGSGARASTARSACWRRRTRPRRTGRSATSPRWTATASACGGGAAADR